MGQYEPNDSRNVTLDTDKDTAGLKPTGGREAEARAKAEKGKDSKDKRDDRERT
ncbi:hypothetical protein HME9302_00155 [Alteripontixanthobacter maritimus]|uniref:Uncharacterized protein n=1 Tax=Alteripontixanthobacter maritimus TaxID=2161824 RepID=A0A369Q9L4_9SPHN|nr:hypothetical protein [Alteripontixanthobacter maritimus]RDC58978.1 hypothetical protein HME9302_00155 [Alteripontixanthobacter maritimus]